MQMNVNESMSLPETLSPLDLRGKRLGMAKELIQPQIDAKAADSRGGKNAGVLAGPRFCMNGPSYYKDGHFDAEAYAKFLGDLERIADKLHEQAVASGASEMTLEEINEEIAAARREMDESSSAALPDN